MVEEKRGPGGGRQEGRGEVGSCIVLRFWFEPIVTNNGGHVLQAEGGTGGGGSMNSSDDDRDR